MVSLTCESGIGERGFYAAQMCGEMPIQFHKAGEERAAASRRTRGSAPPTARRSIARSTDRSATRFSASTKDRKPAAPGAQERADRSRCAAADRLSDAGVHAGIDVPHPVSLRCEEQLLRRDQRRSRRTSRSARSRTTRPSGRHCLRCQPRGPRRRRRRRRRAICPTCAA